MGQDIQEWHRFARYGWQTLLTRDGQPINGIAYRRWIASISAWEYRHATQDEIDALPEMNTP